MKIMLEPMDSFPPNSNPYHYDHYNMGQDVGKDLHMMFSNHSNTECKFLILIDKVSGERVKVLVDQDAPQGETVPESWVYKTIAGKSATLLNMVNIRLKEVLDENKKLKAELAKWKEAYSKS